MPEVVDIERQRRYTDTLAWGIGVAMADRRLRARLDPHHEAEWLVVLVNGAATQAVLDPERFPPAVQRRIVGDHLATLR